MEHTQSEYDEAVKDYGIIDDLNVAIKNLIIQTKGLLGGGHFGVLTTDGLPDDLEEQIHDLTSMAFDPRVSEMRKIFENGNPLYQTVRYINEHGGAYDC